MSGTCRFFRRGSFDCSRRHGADCLCAPPEGSADAACRHHRRHWNCGPRRYARGHALRLRTHRGGVRRTHAQRRIEKFSACSVKPCRFGNLGCQLDCQCSRQSKSGCAIAGSSAASDSPCAGFIVRRYPASGGTVRTGLTYRRAYVYDRLTPLRRHSLDT